MKDSKASAKRVKGAENRGRALELRKSGASYRQIGEALGISMQRAHQLIMDELDRLSQLRLGNADELRRLELERIEMVALAIVGWVKKGDIKAGHLWLKTCESRRKLLGLDAPTRLEASGPGGGPIPIAAVDLTKLSEADLATLADLVAKAGAEGSPS